MAKQTIAVVGAAPSLDMADLEELHRTGIPSISAGRIHVVFDRTNWRPEEVVIADTDYMQDFGADVLTYIDAGIRVHIRCTNAMRLTNDLSMTNLYFWDYPEGIWVYPHCGHMCLPSHTAHLDVTPRSWSGKLLCSYGYSGHIAAQRAVMMGADRILLVGHDGLYQQEHPYCDERYLESAIEDWKVKELNYVLPTAWAYWKQELEKVRGVEILNCSAHSTLDLFPKASPAEIFSWQ